MPNEPWAGRTDWGRRVGPELRARKQGMKVAWIVLGSGARKRLLIGMDSARDCMVRK